MNRCADVTRLLPEYLEGELSPLERRHVAGHLEVCRACRSEAALWNTSLSALRTVPRRKAPSHLYAGFAAARDRGAARPAPMRAPLQWASAAALVLVLAGSVATVLRAPRAEQAGVPVRVAVAPPGAISRPAPVVGSGPAAASMRAAVVPVTSARLAPDTEPARGSAKPQSVALSSGGDEARRPATHPRVHARREQVASAGSAFLSVSDSRGRTVREALAVSTWRHRGAAVPMGGSPNSASDPSIQDGRVAARPVLVEAALDERVRVGGQVTRVTGNRGWDARGRLAMIQVAAESEPDE